jgi:hypothetical protein
MKRTTASSGVIRLDEAYSKRELLTRLGVSQRFWDQMLDDGLPYSIVGHTRWVTGEDVIEHLKRHSAIKTTARPSSQIATSFPKISDGRDQTARVER